jgi:hypothetical protein
LLLYRQYHSIHPLSSISHIPSPIGPDFSQGFCFPSKPDFCSAQSAI